MAKTTSKKLNNLNNFSTAAVHKRVNKSFKKQFGKKISAKKIDQVWKDYMQFVFTSDLLNGETIVPLDRKGYGRFEIVKMLKEDTIAGKLFAKGVMFQRSGKVKKEVDVNQMRWNFVYKVRYTSSETMTHGIMFKANPKITLQLCNILSTTGKDYKFEMK